LYLYLKYEKYTLETKNQELSFRLLMEASPIALILTNRLGKIIYLNNFAETLFSYQRNDLTNRGLDVLLPEMIAIYPPDFWTNYFTNPTMLRLGGDNEFSAQMKSGAKFPVEVRMNPIETGLNTYVLTAITDLSDRLKANEQFRLIVESALNAMILTAADGTIELVNRQTELLFGYDRNELTGKKIEVLVPQRMKQHHPEHRKNFYAHPKARPMGAGRDLFGVKKDGTEVPLEIGLNPVEKNGVQYVLASVIDITERKKNEENIRVYARQIEEKNKELEEFTHVASHDLKEPLNSIISITGLLMEKKKDQLDEESLRMVELIGKSSNRMTELITDLLDYAQLGNSKELVFINLNDMVKTVLLDLNSSIEASGAKVYIDRLPVLHVYAMEFRLLLQNIISNALKYRKHDVSPEIKVSAERVKEGWEFAISDNGIGIPVNQTDKIFNLFHRLHGRNEYEGTGIGLAHCRKIAELHNGKIWVESQPGKGSTFYFFIPSVIK
jgi:PAS domain S-box-containing protein